MVFVSARSEKVRLVAVAVVLLFLSTQGVIFRLLEAALDKSSSRGLGVAKADEALVAGDEGRGAGEAA